MSSLLGTLGGSWAYLLRQIADFQHKNRSNVGALYFVGFFYSKFLKNNSKHWVSTIDFLNIFCNLRPRHGFDYLAGHLLSKAPTSKTVFAVKIRHLLFLPGYFRSQNICQIQLVVLGCISRCILTKEIKLWQVSHKSLL